MPARCPHCSESVSAGARFCPHCGKAIPDPAPDQHRSIDLRKMPAPLPLAGYLFLSALILAPTSIILGFALGINLLIYVGIVLLIALAVLLVLGMFY